MLTAFFCVKNIFKKTLLRVLQIQQTPLSLPCQITHTTKVFPMSVLSYLEVAIKMKRRGGVFFLLSNSKTMTRATELSELRNRIVALTHLLEGCENISPFTIQVVDEFYLDALISTDREMIGSAALLMRAALGKSAERIVVLESLLESERKLRQADEVFALKNATHL